MANIWLLQTGEPLPVHSDVRKLRTGLIADKLVKKGHQVRWWVSGFEHQRKKQIFQEDQEVALVNGSILQVLCGCGYQKNISLARYFDHWLIAKKFRKIAPQFPDPDLLLISMPCYLLAFEAARYAQKRNIPYIVDVRDLWPDIFVSAAPGKIGKTFARAILSPDYAKVEYLLKNARGITAMSESILLWALQKAKRQRSENDDVFYLGYKKYDQIQKQEQVNSMQLPKTEGKRLIVFIGTFGLSYELSLLLDAAEYFYRQGNREIHFVLAGDGEQEGFLKKKAAALQNVTFTGWLGKKDISSLLKKASVGIIPCKSVVGAFPNKTFEYFSFGIPVLSSLEGEVADKINKFRMGFNYKHGDLSGLCEALKLITSDLVLRDQMALNAFDFFEKYGDAETLYLQYCNYIETFLNG